MRDDTTIESPTRASVRSVPLLRSTTAYAALGAVFEGVVESEGIAAKLTVDFL
jgi:hypothetical protein